MQATQITSSTEMHERRVVYRSDGGSRFLREPRAVVRPAPVQGLLELASRVQPRLISFDVFDTVVTREVGDPAAVFHLLGRDLHDRGLIPLSAEAFMQARIAAERRTRRNHPGEEVTLRQIHEELVFSLPWEADLEAFMDAELRLERSLMYPIHEMAVTLEALRRQFGRVVFVSDMYLPDTFLEECLRAFGLMQPKDTLYLSSKHGGWKGDGRLFRTVLQSEALEPAQLLHCGNCAQADIAGARSLGIHSFHYTHANPNASEQVLNAHSVPTDALGSLIAGASRKVRLEGPKLDGDARVAWDTGASVTGPLILMYARWVIDRALEKGIKRLLFLARDAYLPYLAVKHLLASQPGLGLEAHYVYGSRATYFALGVAALDEAEWTRLVSHHGKPYSTIRDLKNALMGRDETFTRHLTPLGFGEDTWDRPLSTDEFARVRRHVLENSEFNRALAADLDGFRNLMRAYFQEMGVFDSGGAALVDTGWSTTSHAPLFTFLKNEGCRPLRLFYVGMYGKRADVPLQSLDTFLFNRLTAHGPRDPRFEYPRAFETLLMAPHGRTVGFGPAMPSTEDVSSTPSRTRAGVQARLAGIDNPTFIQKHFALYEAAVLRLVDECVPYLPARKGFHDHRELADAVIRRFWSKPTRDEARLWSGMEWEADQLGTVKYKLARPYRWTDAWKAFAARRYPACYRQFWVDGAVALTPPRTLFVLRLVLFLRRTLGKVARLTPAPIASRARFLGKAVRQRSLAS